MKVTITVDMDHAAFEGAEAVELARILRQIAHEVDFNNSISGVVPMDLNGNKVGTITGK